MRMEPSEVIQEAVVARAVVRRKIIDVLEREQEIDTQAVVDVVLEEIAAQPASIQERLAAQALSSMIREELRGLVHQYRQLATRTTPMTREEFDIRVSRLTRMMFESTAPGKRIAIASMKRPDLRAAIAAREKQVAGHRRWIGFERDLVEQMPNDKVTVSEFFPETQLTETWQRHFEK